MKTMAFPATWTHATLSARDRAATDDRADYWWIVAGVAIGAASGAVMGTVAIAIAWVVSASVIGQIVAMPLMVGGAIAPVLGGLAVLVGGGAARTSPVCTSPRNGVSPGSSRADHSL